MLLCRNHHIEIHKLGRTTFVTKYELKDYMFNKGWEICPITGKWNKNPAQ